MTTNFKSFTRSIVTKAIGILVVMALILATAPQHAMAASIAEATEATCKANYTVKSGDYLIKIANNYDVDWRNLADANDLKSPYVIYVGLKLCIPGKSSSGSTDGTTGTSGKASFTAVKNKESLVITTSNFPTKSFYYVKADDPRDKRLEWHKIGVLSTGKETSVKNTFKLPDELRNPSTLTVCLKNIYNDNQICNNPNYNHDATKSDSGSGSVSASWKGTFTVRFVSKNIEVKTTNLPSNSFFNVRADNASGKALDWQKIGILRTGKSGSVTQTFSLPESLEKATRVTVCLKNLVNDTVACHVASR